MNIFLVYNELYFATDKVICLYVSFRTHQHSFFVCTRHVTIHCQMPTESECKLESKDASQGSAKDNIDVSAQDIQRSCEESNVIGFNNELIPYSLPRTSRWRWLGW